MKRLLVLIAAFLAAFSLGAAPVSEQRARKVASDFFAGADDWERLPDAPEGCYVFNRKSGGFVIVSADDCALPVLGYSHSGRFTLKGAPDNLRAWTDATAKVIRAEAAKGRVPGSALKAVWEAPALLSRAGVAERLINTATWGQNAPFNYYTPTVDGAKSIAGCVAVAMAIIMRHYRWPAAGNGVLPNYTYTSEKGTRITQSGHALGHSYDWDDMPLNHVGEDNRSVAQLIYDCGIAVESAYNEDGTSAYANDAPAKMALHFSYSMSAILEQRSYFSTSAWMARLKAEIDADRPVLYSAFSEAKFGHAFVVDGYDAAFNLHVNWGWQGSCNGYFALDCFYPYEGSVPSKEKEHGYYYRHGAVFDLVPDKTGTSRPRALLCMRSSGDMQGLRLVSGNIAKGSTFRLEFGLCTNRGLYDYSGGALRVGLLDRNGNLKGFVGNAESVPLLEPNYGAKIRDYIATLSTEPVLGDVLRVFYLDGSDWVLMPYGLDDGTVGYLNAGPDICFIQKEAAYYAGQKLQPSLILGNKAALSVRWSLDGVTFEEATPPLTSGTHRLKAVLTYEDGSSETILQEITVP